MSEITNKSLNEFVNKSTTKHINKYTTKSMNKSTSKKLRLTPLKTLPSQSQEIPIITQKTPTHHSKTSFADAQKIPTRTLLEDHQASLNNRLFTIPNSLIEPDCQPQELSFIHMFHSTYEPFYSVCIATNRGYVDTHRMVQLMTENPKVHNVAWSYGNSHVLYWYTFRDSRLCMVNIDYNPHNNKFILSNKDGLSTRQPHFSTLIEHGKLNPYSLDYEDCINMKWLVLPFREFVRSLMIISKNPVKPDIYSSFITTLDMYEEFVKDYPQN